MVPALVVCVSLESDPLLRPAAGCEDQLVRVRASLVSLSGTAYTGFNAASPGGLRRCCALGNAQRDRARSAVTHCEPPGQGLAGLRSENPACSEAAALACRPVSWSCSTKGPGRLPSMVRRCCARRMSDCLACRRVPNVRRPKQQRERLHCPAVAGSQGTGVKGGQGSGCHCQQQGQEEGAPACWWLAPALMRASGRAVSLAMGTRVVFVLAEMVKGQDEGEGQQPGPLRQGERHNHRSGLAANSYGTAEGPE